VIGPFAWPAFEHGRSVFRGAAPVTELGYLAGWSLAPGLALVLLGGCALGVAMRGRAAVVPAATSSPAAPIAMTTTMPVPNAPTWDAGSSATPATPAWVPQPAAPAEPSQSDAADSD
jgi:hypothetical protein